MILIAEDTLDDSSGVSLAAHTPSGGGSWALAAGTGDITFDTANRIQPPSGNNVSSLYEHSATPANADHSAEVTAQFLTANNAMAGVAVRIDAANDNGYIFGIETSGTDRWSLVKVVGGTYTQIGSLAFGFVGNALYPMRLSIRDNEIICYAKSIYEMQLRITDTSITANGKTGVYMRGPNTDTTGIHITEFKAWDSEPLDVRGVTSGSASTASPAPTKPPNVQNGDLLVVAIKTVSTTEVSVPSGWTLIGTAPDGTATATDIWTYYKIANNEPSSWTWTFADSGALAWGCVAYIGTAGITLDDFDPSSNPNTTTVPFDSVDLTQPNGLLVAMIGASAGFRAITSVPANTTAEVVYSGQPPFWMFHERVSAAGATGGRSFVFGNSNLASILAAFSYAASNDLEVPLGVITRTAFTPVPTAKPSAPLGSIAFTGLAPEPRVSAVSPLGTIIITGFAPAPTVRQDVPLGTVLLTGFIPTIGQQVTFEVPLGTLAFLGLNPSASALVSTPLGMVTLTGLAANPAAKPEAPLGSISGVPLAPSPMARATAPLGQITYTGIAPGLAASAAVPIGQITITGLPVLLGMAVDVPLGTIATAGLTPALNTRANVPLGTVTLVGLNPAIGQSVEVPLGTITSVGFTPEGLRLIMPVGEVLLEGLTPEMAALAAMPVGTIQLQGLAVTVDAGGVKVFEGDGIYLVKSFNSDGIRLVPDFAGELRIVPDFEGE